MTEQEQQDLEGLTIGQFLKQEREKKNLSVKTISQHTKISTTKLELIEEDNFTELPSQAYIRGFVKSYAKTLNLNQDTCLELLDKAYGVKKESIPEEHLEKLSDTDKPSIESFSGLPLGKIVTVVAVITAIVGILVFVGQSRPPSEPIQEITPKSVDSDTPLAVSRTLTTALNNENLEEAPEELQKEVEEEPEEVVEQDKKPKKTKEDSDQPDQSDESEVSSIDELEVNIRPFPGPTFDWDTEMPKSKIDELLPDEAKTNAPDGEHHVFIKAVTGKTWLTYKSDDRSIRRFILSEGRDILLRGTTHRIFLGNIEAIEVFVNNRPIDIQSRTGVKSLVIPRDSYQDFSLPLFIYPQTGGVLTSEEYIQTLKDIEAE
jgi:cytoskeletal protein RodZ